MGSRARWHGDGPWGRLLTIACSGAVRGNRQNRSSKRGTASNALGATGCHVIRPARLALTRVALCNMEGLLNRQVEPNIIQMIEVCPVAGQILQEPGERSWIIFEKS